MKTFPFWQVTVTWQDTTTPSFLSMSRKPSLLPRTPDFLTLQEIAAGRVTAQLEGLVVVAPSMLIVGVYSIAPGVGEDT